jgi:hypothetical protein
MAKQLTPEEIVQKHEATVQKSLEKTGLRQHLTVHFENRAKVPIIGKLGVWLVNKAGGKIVTKYSFNGKINSKVRQKK